MPTIGDEILTNQLGTNGVILKNSIYQNKCSLLSTTLKNNIINQ